MSVFAKQTSRFVKLKNVGDSVSGIITEISEPRQATKYDPRPDAPRVPDFWESSDGGAPRPKMEIVLTLQTDINEGPDDSGNADDGKRKLVVPIFYKEGSMLSSIQNAIIGAGGQDIELGAWVGVRHTGHDPASANPQNPRKLYEAAYRRPAGGGGAFQANAGQPAAQQPAAQPAQQFQPPAAQPAAQPAAYQPPVAVNQQTGEVGGQAAAPSWGGQTAAGAPVAGAPEQAWSAPATAYVPPANPTPEQAQAMAHFPAAQTAWQPPAAAAPAPAPAAPPAAPQMDAAAIKNLIAQGAPDGYILENVPGSTPEAVAAIRNAPQF